MAFTLPHTTLTARGLEIQEEKDACWRKDLERSSSSFAPAAVTAPSAPSHAAGTHSSHGDLSPQFAGGLADSAFT